MDTNEYDLILTASYIFEGIQINTCVLFAVEVGGTLQCHLMSQREGEVLNRPKNVTYYFNGHFRDVRTKAPIYLYLLSTLGQAKHELILKNVILIIH